MVMQQQAGSGAQQRGKKSALVAGLGAAFVAAGITFAVLSSGLEAPPSPSSAQATAPAQTAMQVQAPPVQIAPPVQVAPSQTAPPVQTAAVPLAPQARSCPRRPLVEIAHVEHGGSGVVRFHEGDYVSPWITLSDEDQPIVFPAPRRDTIFRDSIVIEGRATGLVLGADGDRFEVPSFDGSYNYTMDWHAAQKCE
jgi:hypothetical protein